MRVSNEGIEVDIVVLSIKYYLFITWALSYLGSQTQNSNKKPPPFHDFGSMGLQGDCAHMYSGLHVVDLQNLLRPLSKRIWW